MKQVLLNLLANAIKYNRPDGLVTVSTDVRSDHVRLSVADTGLGISPELTERLFIPFDRLNVGGDRYRGNGSWIGTLEELE